MIRRFIPPLAALLLTLVPIAPASAQELEVWTIGPFADTPEGLAVAPDGTMYTALMHLAEIHRIDPDGSHELVAVVPSEEHVGEGEVIGIDLDAEGTIYVAYKGDSERWEATNLSDPFHAACRDATVTTSGVYKVDPDTGAVTALATRAEGWPFCFPDDVEIDALGNVYMTDLTYSGVWKISPDGAQVELWSAHPLLNWQTPPYSGIPIGVNVLVLDAAEENLYVATDAEPMVLRIPIESDGSAGEPVVISSGHSPFDGIEFDDRGNIYVSEILRNEIWVLSPDGSQRMLVADKRTAPLDEPTSLIWHEGTLCTSNLGYTHFPDYQAADRTIVCMRGFDRP